MSSDHDSMTEPNVEHLLERVDSKFTLVSVSAKRAREINSYFNQLGDGLGKIVPPQVHSTARKPLSIAFEEMAADKISWERFDPEEEAALQAAAEAQAAEDAARALELIEGGAGDDGDEAS